MLPPSPAHILRGHSAHLNALSFSSDNERLYSGDSSGQVIVTSTHTLRPIASWRAHNDGILGIQEWNEDSIITHGRDYKLHVWARVYEPTSLAETAMTPALRPPSLKFSMDVNTLNYCRFSLLPQLQGDSRHTNALLALPNLIDSSLADVWAIPSVERLHAAIGKDGVSLSPRDGRTGPNKMGIIMSLHLFRSNHIQLDEPLQLCLFLAYENGSVSLVTYRGISEKSVEGEGWDRLWTVKSHVESVMAMCVQGDNVAAFTVSADHLVCRYELEESGEGRSTIYRTKHPGNGAITIRDDGRVIAVGGWDGRVRLYSSKTFKALGTLDYHTEGCYAIAFAHAAVTPRESEGDTEGIYEEEREARTRWLATGGKDGRVSIWKLIHFNKK